MLLAIQLQPFAWSVRKPHNYKGRMTSGWMATLKAIPCSPQLALCTAILHTPSPCSLDPSTFAQSIICAESQSIPSPQVRESVGSHPSTLALSLPPSLTLIRSVSPVMLLEALIGKCPPGLACSQDPLLSTTHRPWIIFLLGLPCWEGPIAMALSFRKEGIGTPTGQEGDPGLCLRTLVSFLFWLLSRAFSIIWIFIFVLMAIILEYGFSHILKLFGILVPIFMTY